MASGFGPAGHELSFDPLLSSTFNIDFGSPGGSAGGAYSNSLLAHGQGAAGGGFAAPLASLQPQVRPICRARQHCRSLPSASVSASAHHLNGRSSMTHQDCNFVFGTFEPN